MTSKKRPEPCVGIFWVFDGQLIVDSTPVSQAQIYGNSLGHATGHVDHWALLQQSGTVPPEVEYEEPPRGRVVYDKCEKRFYLLGDRCILAQENIVQMIMTAFHLPLDATSTGEDAHYRCSECLYGESSEEDWDVE